MNPDDETDTERPDPAEIRAESIRAQQQDQDDHEESEAAPLPTPSDTPLTDARSYRAIIRYGVIWHDMSGDQSVDADFARTLERELTATKAERDEANRRAGGGTVRAPLLGDTMHIETATSRMKAEVIATKPGAALLRAPLDSHKREAHSHVWVLLSSLRVEQVPKVGSSRVDLQACKLEYSIVSPK